jgi:hypothetical protein
MSLSAKHSVYAGRGKSRPQPAPPGCGLSTSLQLRYRSAGLTSFEECLNNYNNVMFGKNKIFTSQLEQRTTTISAAV